MLLWNAIQWKERLLETMSSSSLFAKSGIVQFLTVKGKHLELSLDVEAAMTAQLKMLTKGTFRTASREWQEQYSN